MTRLTHIGHLARHGRARDGYMALGRTDGDGRHGPPEHSGEGAQDRAGNGTRDGSGDGGEGPGDAGHDRGGGGARAGSGQGGGPARRRGPSGWAVLRRTARKFGEDELTDRAAALTYYGVLSLFPALLVLVSLLGVAGHDATGHVVDTLRRFAPASAGDTITEAVRHVQANSSVGSALAVVGLLGAVWSASGYVAAFIRTANAVYGIPEGRPAWQVLLVRLGVTVALTLLACASTLIVVFTGSVARRAGSALGAGDTALTAWSVAKWPVLVVLVSTMISLLYWASPNVKARGVRWVAPGSCLALLIWMAASAGFAVYVAHFGSYNKTYGALAGVIVFLVWMWIGNLAVLLGLEFDSELARERALTGRGRRVRYAEPRGTRKWSARDRRRAEE
ncbi:hypothetical protein GCM10018793_60000 [Streptomyces sulfonofaciens]|uniref:Uncharacterized protein n=1 Tax=Streptomyces sulfonofaciens TaxID=68272 RepID=A0A919GM11_9ACTN|nr:YihY/virulence factor BrkB family protein [Streptomyces sulfonofaciens]GHH86774.1 hypothetical protein GCM10018793_60000 [Streptomyces sulfonofaciens]